MQGVCDESMCDYRPLGATHLWPPREGLRSRSAPFGAVAACRWPWGGAGQTRTISPAESALLHPQRISPNTPASLYNVAVAARLFL